MIKSQQLHISFCCCLFSLTILVGRYQESAPPIFILTIVDLDYFLDSPGAVVVKTEQDTAAFLRVCLFTVEFNPMLHLFR